MTAYNMHAYSLHAVLLLMLSKNERGLSLPEPGLRQAQASS